MTPALQDLFDVSTRIREYEAASDALKVLARLATDLQVRSSLQQQAEELAHTAGQWRARQDAELAKVSQHGPPGGSYAKYVIPPDVNPRDCRATPDGKVFCERERGHKGDHEGIDRDGVLGPPGAPWSSNCRLIDERDREGAR